MEEKKIVIANWKMNMSYKKSEEFLNKLRNHELYDAKIVICPSSLHIPTLIQKFPNLNFGIQNLTNLSANFGSFTGEISAKMAAEIGVKYAILGHTERRNFFGESNLKIKQKAENALTYNITPIICIGETVKERLLGRTESYLKSQIRNCVPKTSKEIIIAYEPFWAVGAGKMPPKKYINEIMKFIRENISKVANNAIIVYGGSVNGEAASWLSKIEYLDGVLVGSAATKFGDFTKILKPYA